MWVVGIAVDVDVEVRLLRVVRVRAVGRLQVSVVQVLRGARGRRPLREPLAVVVRGGRRFTAHSLRQRRHIHLQKSNHFLIEQVLSIVQT